MSSVHIYVQRGYGDSFISTLLLSPIRLFYELPHTPVPEASFFHG